ncbi:MAG: hypothetical protein ACRELD_16980, partial [Longimicrobiales bacterium]
MRSRLSLLLVAAGFALAPAALGAQSALDRAPNLSAGWTGPGGMLYFDFLHRFTQSGEPERKITSSPTFLLAGTPTSWLLVGAHYATNSRLVARYPNEWEAFARVRPRWRLPLLSSVAVQAGYNIAAQSLDGELSVTRTLGPAQLIGALRAFSDAYGTGESAVAGAAGIALRVHGGNMPIALVGDIAARAERADGERAAWSAGIAFTIPYTPHTLSLHASNTATSTLQGATRGDDLTRYGFEFTVPLTLARFRAQPERAPEPGVTEEPAEPAEPDPGDVAPATPPAQPPAPAHPDSAEPRPLPTP